jgi:hypothetical protein
MNAFDTTLDLYLDNHPLQLIIVKLACKLAWPFEYPNPENKLNKGEFYLSYDTIIDRCKDGFFGRVVNGKAVKGVSKKMVRMAFEDVIFHELFIDLKERVKDLNNSTYPKKYKFKDNKAFWITDLNMNTRYENKKQESIQERSKVRRAQVTTLVNEAIDVVVGTRGLGGALVGNL